MTITDKQLRTAGGSAHKLELAFRNLYGRDLYRVTPAVDLGHDRLIAKIHRKNTARVLVTPLPDKVQQWAKWNVCKLAQDVHDWFNDLARLDKTRDIENGILTIKVKLPPVEWGALTKLLGERDGR